MLPKKTLISLVVIVIVVLALGVWLGFWVLSLRSPDPTGPSKYSAVYMATGDIYFGELNWFPRLHLTNVWFLQRSVGVDNQTSFGVVPFSNSFWGPSNEIDINPTQIVFYTRLRNDSQVAKVFDNPGLLNQPASALPPSTSPSTSSSLKTPQSLNDPSSGPRGSGQVPPTGAFNGPNGPPPSGK